MAQEYKTWIIETLENWAETFNNYYPDHMEEIIEEEDKAYNYIYSLINKINGDSCSKDDYDNILFHLWQSKSE
ncbi:MAG: hypothetical protein QM486_00590 [Flavobacteriaceae bacterium]